MIVLVACECSERVKLAFMKEGHDAHSCDLKEGELRLPNHHQCDILELLRSRWAKSIDLMIAHPPCTYLSRAGARWLYVDGGIDQERLRLGFLAKTFFLELLNSSVPRIAVENPTPLKIFQIPKETQIIQPYEFGEPYSKRTLLWLKNLPVLMPTLHVLNHKPLLPSNTGYGRRKGQRYQFKTISQEESSRTLNGIAQAMAQQWGCL